MHLFKHVVESRGANTAQRCHEEVVQVVYIETGLSGKKKKTGVKENEKRGRKMLRSVSLGVIQD